MNGLSWLLYLADTSEGLRLFAIFAWVISFLVVLVSALITMAVLDAKPTLEEAEKVKDFNGKVFWFFGPMFVVFLLTYILVPQRQTFMLIAASEFGEEVINTSAAQSIGGEAGDLAVDSLSLLRKYINDQLDTEDVPSDTEK